MPNLTQIEKYQSIGVPNTGLVFPIQVSIIAYYFKSKFLNIRDSEITASATVKKSFEGLREVRTWSFHLGLNLVSRRGNSLIQEAKKDRLTANFTPTAQLERHDHHRNHK